MKLDSTAITNELKGIMNRYDIKHPLRGEEYEDADAFQQKFAEKIIYKAQDSKSYINYKND